MTRSVGRGFRGVEAATGLGGLQRIVEVFRGSARVDVLLFGHLFFAGFDDVEHGFKTLSLLDFFVVPLGEGNRLGVAALFSRRQCFVVPRTAILDQVFQHADNALSCYVRSGCLTPTATALSEEIDTLYYLARLSLRGIDAHRTYERASSLNNHIFRVVFSFPLPSFRLLLVGLDEKPDSRHTYITTRGKHGVVVHFQTEFQRVLEALHLRRHIRGFAQ